MPSVSSVKGNMNGGNKLPFITQGEIAQFVEKSLSRNSPKAVICSTEHEEASLEEVEVIDETSMVGEGDYCGWFGLPPAEAEMLPEDPAVINSLLAEKARLEKPNEGMDGTF